MSVYVDPLTAITLAHDARADRIRQVAESRRMLEATREARPDAHEGQETRAHPAVRRLLAAALRRRPAVA